MEQFNFDKTYDKFMSINKCNCHPTFKELAKLGGVDISIVNQSYNNTKYVYEIRQEMRSFAVERFSRWAKNGISTSLTHVIARISTKDKQPIIRLTAKQKVKRDILLDFLPYKKRKHLISNASPNDIKEAWIRCKTDVKFNHFINKFYESWTHNTGLEHNNQYIYVAKQLSCCSWVGWNYYLKNNNKNGWVKSISKLVVNYEEVEIDPDSLFYGDNKTVKVFRKC